MDDKFYVMLYMGSDVVDSEFCSTHEEATAYGEGHLDTKVNDDNPHYEVYKKIEICTPTKEYEVEDVK